MVNQNARDILKSAKRNMQDIKGAPRHVWDTILHVLRALLYGKFAVTFFLVAWLLGISILLLYRRKLNKSNENIDLLDNDDNHVRFYNLHRVWFGDESIILIIVKLWFYTAILWMLGPVLRELAVLIKLKLIL